MHLVSIGVGLALLVLAALDLFRTVLDYGGYGPISHRLYRLIWRIVRRGVGPGPAGLRLGLLASAGPLMLLASVGTWVLMAVVGFTLIYLHAMPGGFSFQDAPGEPIIDALYFSLVSISTVGYGDIVAVAPTLRIASALEALVGFVILTLTISYMLGVYQVVRDQSVVAAMISDLAGDAGGPLDVGTSILRHDSTDGVLTELHRELVMHNEGLQRYPLAYYFRRRQAHRTALYVLRQLGEAASFMRWILPDDHPSSRSPALAALILAERRLVEDLRDRFLAGDVAELPTDHLDDRWAAGVERARALGIFADPVASDGRRAAWNQFTGQLGAVVLAAAWELRLDEHDLGPAPR